LSVLEETFGAAGMLLRELLNVASGGVVFTTIQKFFPDEKGGKHLLLSDRRNIVVIADEAHRSQYNFIDGFAKHMRDALPKASFSGFTGTPIESGDKNTQAVFGDLASQARHQLVSQLYHSRFARRGHWRLRHPAIEGRQGHRADLLRGATGED